MSERESFERWVMGLESADEITLERLRHGDRIFDEYANKEIEAMWISWKARTASREPSKDCIYCNGTGEADSGGIHPWGAPATIPCRCMYEDPFHVHVSAYNNIAAQLEEAQGELRRLAQVEAEHAALLKAISDAKPVAWSAGIEWHPIKHYQSEQVQKLTRKEQKEYGFTIPLYTLNGIKPAEQKEGASK